MPSLVYQDAGRGAPSTFELHKRVTSIGSGPDNDLVLRDPTVADTHALVRFDGRAFTLQCLAPDAEIVVNGRPRARHVL